MPTECSANATEACQREGHGQLQVSTVEGTNGCNMAPFLLSDEVAGANSADSFCFQCPKNVS